jgi:protein-S-isoprenylcysteine O-methyltransferase Ste14
LVLSIFVTALNLVVFASIHSFMASLSFKRLIVRVLGSWADKLYIPIYSLIVVITLLPLVYLLKKYPGRLLYTIPSPWSWLMIGGQKIAFFISPKSLLDGSHRFNIRSQLSGPAAPDATPLNIRGIYRWIRDPFTLSALIIMLLTSLMTVNRLVTYILTTIYLYIGYLHWENRLVLQFGDEYREYQKHVHRLIPFFRK